jgi:hypothetical protein
MGSNGENSRRVEYCYNITKVWEVMEKIAGM